MLLEVLDRTAPDMIGTNVYTICLNLHRQCRRTNTCIAVTVGRSQVIMIDKLQIAVPKYDPALGK